MTDNRLNKPNENATPAAPVAVPEQSAAEPQTVTLEEKEKLVAAQKETVTAQERYLRAVADFDNFRKRTIREKDELRQLATTSLMENLLPVLDNLNLGLAAAKQQSQSGNSKNIVEGIAMVLEQFKTVLGHHGLKEVNPADGVFDPNFHESIGHQPSAEVPAEKVSQVVRLGFILNGRLLRPASVILSSGPEETKS